MGPGRIGVLGAVVGLVLGAAVAGGGPVADCDICTQAQQCCEVVQVEQPTCTFSAAKCAAQEGDGRPAYVNACRTYLVTVRRAWKGNPPAACR